jgi:hypothetical protein
VAANELELLPATDAHVLELAHHLRAEDADEGRRSHGLEPLEFIRHAVTGSPVALAGLLGGRVACITGVGHTNAHGEACVWLLTGDVISAEPRAFLRACRPALAKFLEVCPVLFNAIDARYPRAVRWAAWLGFKVGEPVPFGPYGEPFFPIEIRRSSWAA